MRRLKKYDWFVLFLLLIVLLAGNYAISLWDQDEAAYAGFAKRFVETGNWLIPDFTWSEIHKKPPLHFWLISFMYKCFGISEFTTRLSSVLTIFALYLTVLLCGKRFFGHKESLIAVMVLGTSFLVPALGKIALTDGLLLFLSTFCGFALLYVLYDKSFKWVILFWISFSLAMLAKGPPIIIFTGIFVVLLYIFHPRRKNLILLHPWVFFPISLLPLLTWGYLTYKMDGGKLVDWLIDWYIIKRTEGSVLGQSGPPGYYLLSFAIFFIPFVMFLPRSIFKAFRNIKKYKINYTIAGCWLIAGWLIYEFIPSKLPAYVVVAHVPLSVLIAREIKDIWIRKKFLNLTLPFIFQLFLQVCLIVALLSALFLINLKTITIFILTLFSVIYITGLVLLAWFFKKQKVKKFISVLFIHAFLFVFLTWGALLPSADYLKNSTKRVAKFIEKNTVENINIILANKNGSPPSLPFYLYEIQGEVDECYDVNTMYNLYKSGEPYAFILNRDRAVRLNKQCKQADMDTIYSLKTDRLESANYYIMINKAGQTK